MGEIVEHKLQKMEYSKSEEVRALTFVAQAIIESNRKVAQAVTEVAESIKNNPNFVDTPVSTQEGKSDQQIHRAIDELRIALSNRNPEMKDVHIRKAFELLDEKII